MAKSLLGLPVLFLLSLATVAGGQCPVIKNCPQGSLLICDLSDNDTLLWNAAPYTWSPTLELGDLPEAASELVIKVLDTCWLTIPTLSFVLFLDLDADDLLETVVSSSVALPPGVVLANSAFTPGYAQGDTVWFDKRPVADSLRYSFALQTYYNGDTLIGQLRWTTPGSPGQFIAPRLPEGRHRLRWRVESDGVIRVCEHVFRVKDCQAPNIQCQTNISVTIGADSTGTLWVADVLQAVQDNITPTHMLELAIGPASGSGFPLDSAGDPAQSITYTCADVGDQAVKLWVRDRTGNVESCTVTVTVLTNGPACDPPPPTMCARAFWDPGLAIQDVDYRLVWVTADTIPVLDTLHFYNAADSCVYLGTIPMTTTFSLVPYKNDNPLNGVSTYDLVLISRHIIGAQPFNEPWQIVAADVNQSASVTTFDIVELRKLILGIYPEFPHNTSWRFFTADCTFPSNPFTGWCPAAYTFGVMPIGDYPTPILYNALKTGDVNGTASVGQLVDSPVETRGATAVALPDLYLAAGETVEIALRAADAGDWLGFQLGLDYDPNRVSVEAVRPGGLPDWNGGSYALAVPGELRMSWNHADGQILWPGDPLLYLRLRAHTAASLREVFRPSGRLAPELYLAGGEIRTLQLDFSTPGATPDPVLIGRPTPNPTREGITLPLRLAQASPVILELFDPSGRPAFRFEQSLGAGSHRLEVPAEALSQPGLYAWRLQTSGTMAHGKVIKE